jgi:hypothetical protein
MNNESKITNAMRRAALREAESWHELCQMIYRGDDADATRERKTTWQAAREHLADALELQGDERHRAHMIYRKLCELNGVREFE